MKMDWYELLLSRAELLAFDNDDDDNDDDLSGDDDSGDDDDDLGNPVPNKKGNKAKEGDDNVLNMTQEELNKIVAKRNKKLKEQYSSLESNYQELLKQQNLTSEQRKKLEASLAKLQNDMLTKEEKLRLEKEKTEQQYQEKLSETEKQANYYKNMYETSTIERAISDAQQKHDGFDSEQFIALLKPKSKIVEEVTSAGEPTGRLVPRIEWNIKKEDGTAEQVLLSPDEVVEKMKDNPEKYGNMFRLNIAKGVGGGTAPGMQSGVAGKIDHKKMSTAEYMEARRKDPNAFRRAAGLSE